MRQATRDQVWWQARSGHADLVIECHSDTDFLLLALSFCLFRSSFQDTDCTRLHSFTVYCRIIYIYSLIDLRSVLLFTSTLTDKTLRKKLRDRGRTFRHTHTHLFSLDLITSVVFYCTIASIMHLLYSAA